MSENKAKMLTEQQFEKALAAASKYPFRLRERVKVMLSHKAGLRAQEISKLRIENLTDAEGRLADTIFVPSSGAKGKRSRNVPMHPALKRELIAYLTEQQRKSGLLVLNDYGKPYEPNTMARWFIRLYERCGFEGCSSHTGRRTFITNAARSANKHGCSVVDVMLWAGHARLSTTQEYVEANDQHRSLIASL